VIEALKSLDQNLLLTINGLHSPWLNTPMVYLSGQSIWLPFIIFILWFSYKQLDRGTFWIFCLFLILSIIASDVTSSYVLKNISQRLRPCRLDELRPLLYDFGQKCGGRFGFVSSHAANSFCLIIYSIKILKLKSWKLYGLGIAALLVSYSRIYLGVHYPGDILGGIMVGGCSALFFVKAFNLRRKTI
jgi:undecaprenyl-diphosphatase